MARRIVIVGGGVIGLCTAYYSALLGHRVTLVDRNSEQRDGCSFGNNGMIVPSHFVPLAAPGMVALGLKWMWNPESPFYIKPRLSWELLDWGFKFWRAANARYVRRAAPLLRDLQFASRACFEELATLPNFDFGLAQRGLLMLCKTQHAFDEEAKASALANQLGVPAEVLDAKQAAALEPNVRMDIAGAVYFPKDCHLSPDRLMADLLAQCKVLGVQFRWQTEVSGFRFEANRIVSATASGVEMDADEFVLCGGVWSPSVVPALGLKLPMQAGRGYSLTLPNPRGLPKICSIFTEARVAVTPMNGTLRFGGTMEMAGLNEGINPARVRGIIKSVPDYFPEFTAEDFAGVAPWSGLRPCSPDGLPYMGRSARLANLTVATGHAMMGLSLAPITGKLMAELLSGRKPTIDLSQLSPDRYE
ncbi:MAG: FAD-dependent oxidoreductase [Pedosphaera sp.]|nr:FAD-dependent oxidoreductase [Pedosphaera sp.]